MAKTHKATVVVARREGGFGGWFSGGKFWAEGKHEGVELSEADINGLARRAGVVVLVGGKVVEAQDVIGPAKTPTELTSDELAALEQYRQQKSAQQAQQAQEPEEKGLQFSKEKKADAVERMVSSPAPSSTLGGADVPLQDANILHGEKPPEGAAGSIPKPLQDAHGKGKR